MKKPQSQSLGTLMRLFDEARSATPMGSTELQTFISSLPSKTVGGKIYHLLSPENSLVLAPNIPGVQPTQYCPVRQRAAASSSERRYVMSVESGTWIGAGEHATEMPADSLTVALWDGKAFFIGGQHRGMLPYCSEQSIWFHFDFIVVFSVEEMQRKLESLVNTQPWTVTQKAQHIGNDSKVVSSLKIALDPLARIGIRPNRSVEETMVLSRALYPAYLDFYNSVLDPVKDWMQKPFGLTDYSTVAIPAIIAALWTYDNFRSSDLDKVLKAMQESYLYEPKSHVNKALVAIRDCGDDKNNVIGYQIFYLTNLMISLIHMNKGKERQASGLKANKSPNREMYYNILGGEKYYEALNRRPTAVMNAGA